MPLLQHCEVAQGEPAVPPLLVEHRSYPVRECLLTLLNEEWWHRQFALRDLAVLEERHAKNVSGR